MPCMEALKKITEYNYSMSFITQPASWVCSLNSINGVSSSKPNLPQSANFKTRHFRTRKIPASLSDDSNGESSDSSGRRSSEDELADIKDPVKRAFAKAKLYKKSKESEPTSPKNNQAQIRVPDSREIGAGKDVSVSDDDGSEPTKEIPLSVKLAMEKANEYKEEKGTAGSNGIVEVKEKDSGLGKANVGNSGYGVREESFRKKEMSAVSSTDFIGLDFGGKKKGRGLPAGLMPMVDSFPDGDFPEVEIIIGDKSKFERKTPVKSESDSTMEDDTELYKPKVSTWGVFPRPSNISKTYGGGRVIRPGEILEESKEKAAKDAQTRKLIAAYKSKTGANIDPKLKTECEKALKDGDCLMDVGKLKDALPYYEKVMKELVFQTELHGLAALQWSICQDSLTRQGEARAMYEKLQAHPNFEVRKKASQLLFSFQAMEMMKVTSSSPTTTTGYSKYFDAFLEDKGSIPLRVGEEEIKEEGKEGALRQALPYIIFLISPILFVLAIAVRKGA